MKLSLIFASALAAFAVACGASDEQANQQEPPAGEPPPAEQAPPASTARQLVEGKQLATSPVNLLADPGFGLVSGQQGGYGSFMAFYEGTYEQFSVDTAIDSRSPAGFGGAVALIRPSGATNKKSEPVLLLTSFLGGAGPFHARIWVSKSDVKGNPVDVPTDGSAVKVSIADGDPDAAEAFDLKANDAATRTIGGRTWVLLEADITKPLTSGGFFLIHTGSKGGFIHLAAPEVTTAQVLVGQAVMRSTSATAVARARTSAERTAMKKYRSVPPRLVPAAPKARIGH